MQFFCYPEHESLMLKKKMQYIVTHDRELIIKLSTHIELNSYL